MLPAPWICRLMTRVGLSGRLRGDLLKSWDVWKTACFLEDNVDLDAAIVDLGAYHSEILPVLLRMGFTKLHGVDLNPELAGEPYHRQIAYSVADFYNTPYEAASIAALTSISAIEHGHDPTALLSEVSRLLRPGGYFIGSTDYWPTKVDTTGIDILGMSWTIFSAAELRRLFDAAEPFGLHPFGSLDFAAGDPVVHYGGRDYTFAWFVLRKIGTL